MQIAPGCDGIEAVIILVAVAIPSFRLLFDQLTIPPAEVAIQFAAPGKSSAR